MNIISGKRKRAIRTVISGVEGVGKSSLASQFPEPLFMDLEMGSDELDVMRFDPSPLSWGELGNAISYVLANKDACKTLVLDTADMAEALCVKYITEKAGVDGLEGFGYGKGYTYLKEEFAKLLKALDSVIKLGIQVVVISHVQVKKFELPDDQGSYDRYALNLSKTVAPIVKDWCDMQLFINYKTNVISVDNTGKKNKATGGMKRVMYTTHTASWDAKNRYGLPDELPLDYGAIAHIFENVDLNSNSKGDNE